MEQHRGKSIYRKVALGKIYFYEKNCVNVDQKKIDNVDEEILRFEKAKEEAHLQLQELYDKAMRELGETNAAIFKVHMMMIDDDDFCNSICSIIRTQKMCAEYATAVTGGNCSEMFAAMDDEYMSARSDDIKDISERLINLLRGGSNKMAEMEDAVILVADDLTPSEIVQMDKSKLIGFVTRYGSANSHTAILARTMTIPALIEVEIKKEWHNKMAVLNGYEGILVVDPDEEYLKKAKTVIADDIRKQELLSELKGKETVTKNGQKIHLYANIGNVTDTGAALINDAEGIGLLRSEFLYLEACNFPTENEHFIAYKMVAEKMAGKKVIIRTLDFGADKHENTALGYCAIRNCLTRQEIFKSQLRAILRASIYGNVAIMFPMIISVDEVRCAKETLEIAKAELKEQGIEYRNIETGIMIETPASVMISDILAKEVDFFSIGTNDLTQYTLAINRQNPRLDAFYDTRHPAILKMIEMTVENAHNNGIWVGLCGELAADLELTETFLRMGIDEISVSPSFILAVREKVRSL